MVMELEVLVVLVVLEVLEVLVVNVVEVVKVVEVIMVVEVVRVVEVVWVVGVVEVVLVVGVFEEAKCPKKKRLTHFKTMPQAAGNNPYVKIERSNNHNNNIDRTLQMRTCTACINKSHHH